MALQEPRVNAPSSEHLQCEDGESPRWGSSPVGPQVSILLNEPGSILLYRQ